jgi:hypothetical protein
MQPFAEALQFIKDHKGTSSATGLAKLILSIYNPNHAFSVAECLSSFDRDRLDLALRMISQYGTAGETDDLLMAGREIYETWPNLIELSNAASDAKSVVREKWRREQEAKWAAEEVKEEGSATTK